MTKKTDEEIEAEEKQEQEKIKQQEERIVQLQRASSEANAAAERLEEIQKRAALGGKSDAGQTPEKPKPLTDEQYADEVLKGRINPLKV